MKLKLPYLGHVTKATNSMESNLMLTKVECRIKLGRQCTRRLDGILQATWKRLSELYEPFLSRAHWHLYIHQG